MARRLRWFLLALALLVPASPAAAQLLYIPVQRLFEPETGITVFETELHVINTVTARLVATVPLGKSGSKTTDVVVSPDHKTAPHWHIRLSVEPLCEQLQLRRGDLATLDTVEEMLEQRGREVLPTDLRQRMSDPVETARKAFFDTCRLDRVGG